MYKHTLGFSIIRLQSIFSMFTFCTLNTLSIPVLPYYWHSRLKMLSYNHIFARTAPSVGMIFSSSPHLLPSLPGHTLYTLSSSVFYFLNKRYCFLCPYLYSCCLLLCLYVFPVHICSFSKYHLSRWTHKHLLRLLGITFARKSFLHSSD